MDWIDVVIKATKKNYLIIAAFMLLAVLGVSIMGCAFQIPTATKTYDEILSVVYPIVDDVASQLYVNQPDKTAMLYLQDRLKALSIESGIVTIVSELGAKGNLSSCIAINTIDRGVVFLSIIPESLEITNEKERLQFVYLTKGKRIGLIPANLSISNDYGWYESYLNGIYTYYDSYEYLAKISGILDGNSKSIDNIKNMIESPPLLLQFYDEAEYNIINNEFARLIDLANERINKYNDYQSRFNEQVNNAEKESSKYPEGLFYVEEYFINPIKPKWYVVSPMPITVTIPPMFIETNVYNYLSRLRNMIINNDTLDAIDSLNKDLYKFDRITDKNFTVKNFRIKW